MSENFELDFEIMVMLIIFTYFLLYLIIFKFKDNKKLENRYYDIQIFIFAIFCYILLEFLYYETDFSYVGLQSDNWFRSTFIFRIRENNFVLEDFQYKNLSAFYAPLYWYVLSIFSFIFQLEPYKMLKIGANLSYFILIILNYSLWKKIRSKKSSFYITIFLFAFSYLSVTFIIDHFIVYMLIIPYVIYYIEGYSKSNELRKKDFKFYLIGGSIGSLLFCTYFFYFLPVVIYAIIHLLKNLRSKQDFIEDLKHYIKIGSVILIFSLYFIIPLAIDILTIGFESHQNEYFINKMIPNMIPFNIFSFDLVGFASIIGLIFILYNYSKKSVSDIKIIGNLIISITILFFIGTILLFLNFPLLVSNFIVIINTILIISFALSFNEIFEFLRKNLKLSDLSSIKKVESILLIFIVSSQFYTNSVSLYESASYHKAITWSVPQKGLDIIDQVDYYDKVFITSNNELMAYRYFHSFISYSVFYSHPSALHHQRADFLFNLQKINSSEDLYNQLVNNPFDRVDFIFLPVINDTLLYFNVQYYNVDSFTLFYREIYLEISLFQNVTYFYEFNIDDYFIFQTK